MAQDGHSSKGLDENSVEDHTAQNMMHEFLNNQNILNGGRPHSKIRQGGI
jgi:hypothetical protein